MWNEKTTESSTNKGKVTQELPGSFCVLVVGAEYGKAQGALSGVGSACVWHGSAGCEPSMNFEAEQVFTFLSFVFLLFEADLLRVLVIVRRVGRVPMMCISE